MSKPVPRRLFLKGLGGAAVAAPFLDTVGWRDARAQSAAPTARLMVMFTHYGCVTNRFFPERSHGQLSAADLEPTTLAALAPYVDKLLLPRGIRAMNEWTSDLSRGQGDDPHQAAASFFTCQPVTPNRDDPFDFTQWTRFVPRPIGPSLDHVIAKQLSPRGTPMLIRVSGRTDNWQSAISYSAAEEPFAGTSPEQAFNSLTGLFAEDVGLSPDSFRVLRGKSVIDVVRDDLATLERYDMSQADRQKLEAWKQLLHETGSAMTGAVCSQGMANLLQLDGTTQAGSGLGQTDVLTVQITDTLDYADLSMNIAVLGAICNANPVTFLKYPAAHTFTGLNAPYDSHSLSHRIDNAGFGGQCVETALDILTTIDAYHARKFAHLVQQLDAIDDGDGTLLDNTAAVWFQEMSDGLAHNLNNLPIVQAGSASGYFKTGWTINVDDGDDALSRGNSEYYCAGGDTETIDSSGAITQATGTHPDFANAPINKYFCNLMNALGVKAGEDGFPLEGGQAEVTRFGMYDKTEDFIGGGTNPATIHDPGEFTALKASST